MSVRGVRGAITASENTTEAILGATSQLLQAIWQANPTLQSAEVASIFFTVTADLTATYPALAARQLGLTAIPLLCSTEIPVPGSLPRCIRVLLHWNTSQPQSDVQHVYLGEARQLRPDLIQADL